MHLTTENKKTLLEARLQELLSCEDPYLKPLYEATKYSLLGGKKLRPLLLLSLLEMYDQPIEVGLDAASAIEMIHTYSMIHDDLPCMDDDNFRRGKPSLHKAFCESTALLAGDFLLTYAFEVLTQSPLLSDQDKILLIRILSKRSGAEGMIGGQFMDLNEINRVLNWKEIHFIHLHKTAALITACFEFAGVIAHVSAEDRVNLTQCGQSLGLAYQIIDDLIDQNEPTFTPNCVHVLGEAKATELAKELLDKTFALLGSLSKKSDYVENLCRSFIDRLEMN